MIRTEKIHFKLSDLSKENYQKPKTTPRNSEPNHHHLNNEEENPINSRRFQPKSRQRSNDNDKRMQYSKGEA